MRVLLLVILLMSSAVFQSWAQAAEVVQLQHRSVDEVLPLIRPLRGDGEVANGIGDQLILSASPDRLVQIKQILASIDRAPRRLRISVMQDVDQATLAHMREVSGSVRLGNSARLDVPGGANQNSLSAQLQRGGDTLNARIDDRDSQNKDHKTQQMQVLEGGRAYIRVGQAVPLPQRQLIQHPWGTEVVEQMQYQDVSSGFYVSPRIRGDNVTLEISTQNDSIGNMQGNYPRQNVQRSSTTLSGRLGEWMEMGGVSQHQESRNDSLNSRNSSQTDESRNVYIKVEEITQ
jgi:type II secretory pathway component GspD/PulD (secretin)